MIAIIEQTKHNIIATRATGKLTLTDYKRLLPIMSNMIETHKKIRWYFEMENFEGWGLRAFWEDVVFDLQHANDYEKIAMVGDKQWEKWMTDLMKPFTTAQVRYYDLIDKDEALKWIEE